MIKSFFAALSFISRLPVPARLSQGLEIEQYQRSIVTFPLVGLLLGAIAGAVALLLQPWCGVPLAALFGVLALALLTGGFHLDGLADTCDGIFSARTRDRMLEIMRDSRLGTHGGLALIFVLVAKVLVVGELLLRDIHPIAALAAACAVGRGMAVLLMYRHRYAREKGLGNLFIGKISLQQTLVAALAHTRQPESAAVESAPQSGMVGDSPAMRALLHNIALVAPSDATVLIHGESGTGKELVARALHALSLRGDKPLVTLNCAALNESLLESELFGHEKGAFTGADKRREGRFVEADGGTLFLDEIGDISPLMQVRLLRAIQEREVQRVGSNQTLSVDVRLIAATHRDLAEEVNAGRFRQDLYYRLNVVAIEMPPLRQRREDIPQLAHHFLRRYGERNRKSVQGFTPQAMDLLIHYDWPGNIRELENAVERAVVLLTGEYISERELPLAIVGTPVPACSSADDVIQPLVEVEKEVILAALEKTGGNKTEAARQLGITRKTLLAKLSR